MIDLTLSEVQRYISVRAPKLSGKWVGGELRGPCPIHHGTRPSFAINEKGQWTCHSECGGIGGDVFDLEQRLSGGDFKEAKPEVFRIIGRESYANGNGHSNGHHSKQEVGPIVACYDYVDEAGHLQHQTTRHYPPKDFRQRRPNGSGGWISDIKGVRLVLYRLPQVIAADQVFITEGEKAVHAVESLGLVGTCSAMGAGKWKPEYSQWLVGKDIIILPDNDTPGQEHAAKVARSLHGRARRVRIVEIPGLPPKGDIADWVEAGGDAEGLWTLVNEVGADYVPESSPEQEPTPKPAGPRRVVTPVVMSIDDIMAVEVSNDQMLVEDILPKKGAVLVIAAAKAGKTVASVGVALAVVKGGHVFGNYSVLAPGPALILEQDDPSGPESVKTILSRAQVDLKNIPFYLVPRVPFSFGPELLMWLEEQIKARGLHLVVLDSYTALRPSRRGGCDIVKVEHAELALLDDLGKRTNSLLLVIHHASKGASGLDWSQQGAGSFAMTAATEAQINLSRFSDLDSDAPERLMRIRGRHQSDIEMVIRFRKDRLDYDFVMDGGASGLYPLVQQLRTHFGSQPFGPKELRMQTGVSAATASRQIDRLFRAGALTRRGYGDYQVVPL